MKIIKDTKRTRITILDNNHIKKEFKPGYEDFYSRSINFLKSINQSGFPKIIEHKDNYYITFPYGKTFTDKGCRVGSLSSNILKQVAEIIFEIHYKGYTHQDIQIGNIAVDNEKVTILDFEHIKKQPIKPFWKNPDLIKTKESSWAYWDTPQPFGIGFNTGINSFFAINHVRNKLKNNLLEVSGPGTKLGDGQAHYSSINLDNFQIEGGRDTSLRFNQFKIDNLKGKTILDIGSNTGALCFESWKRGASKILGIETVEKRVEISKRIASFIGSDNITFKKAFIGKNDWEYSQWDIVFACAIDLYVPNKIALYKYLFNITKEICYFESNVYKNPEKCKKVLYDTGWKNIKYVGRSNDTCGRTNWILKK